MKHPVTYQARWILPVSKPPIANGFVTINDREIVEVSSLAPDGQPVQSLGNRILLPRFVNAHTHLEFSSLLSPFAAEGGFPAWVREVIKWRQLRDSDTVPTESANHSSAIAVGNDESRRVGVALIGEIATSPWPVSGYSNNPRSILFLEQLGILPSQASERLAAVTKRLEELSEVNEQLGNRLGLSPHAPYSLSKSLFEGMVDLGCRRRVPLVMHLAETREEVQWLGGAVNGFSALQERLGVPDEQQWRPALEWLLEQLARAPRALVIHGNYLTGEHWQYLAQNRERMSVVFCPRTHRYFGHSPYPLAEMLSAGVRVAIGTDSRASNPDLNILEELRLVRRAFPKIEPGEILRLGTLNGAEALGEAGQFGQLTPGMSSRLLTVSCPANEELDPVAWLLESDSKVELLEPCREP